jgi:3-oxoacyl-[acyl-carrier protein] reductase
MNLFLENKTVLVTGASSGIGAAVARIFAQEGAHVAISYYRNQEGAEQTATVVRSLGRLAVLCPMDLSDPHAIAAAVAALPAPFDALDALVLCAGKNIVTPIEQITPEEWQDVLAVNLNGPFFALQALAPRVRDGGSIVTVASVAAHTGNANHPHYAAAKAGLVNLTKSFARTLAPRVRVNCVAPGITLTPMGIETTAGLPPDYAQKKLLAGRYATPDEIARWIVFVASPAGAFMTGATVDVNGGRDLR